MSRDQLNVMFALADESDLPTVRKDFHPIWSSCFTALIGCKSCFVALIGYRPCSVALIGCRSC